MSAYRLLAVHITVGADPAVVWTEERELTDRYMKAAPCPDCAGGRPVIFTPPADYHGGLIWCHNTSCPVVMNAMRRAGGAA